MLAAMNLILGLTHHDAVRVAEVAFLLVLISGACLAVGQLPQLKQSGAVTMVAGVLLAAAGLLLGIAVHWGHFG
jgi:hypothetical protein